MGWNRGGGLTALLTRIVKSVSGTLVPLTVIKGAGHEFIPLPKGDNATVADFHT